ncbi:MAG: trypsin-like peptidase domain-containing protein [Planctomycetota bacterium]
MTWRTRFITAFSAFVFLTAALTQAARAEEDFVRLSKEIAPGIVNISVQEKKLGSGFVVAGKTKDYYVVTLLSIAAKEGELSITFSDKSIRTATLHMKKEEINLAVLKVKDPPRNLPTVSLGDSDKLEIGQKVLAVGNPLGDGVVVTAGIVSSLHRAQNEKDPYGDYIQTDASINPGNAGGVLIDIDGDVVGLNVAGTHGRITAHGRPVIMGDAGSGLGYAIPINYVKNVITGTGPGEDIVTMKEMGLGNIQDVNRTTMTKLRMKDREGAYLGSVDNRGLCYKAGLRSGDVVVSYNNTTVKNAGHLEQLVAKTKYGTKVAVTIVGMREGKPGRHNYTINVVREASSSGAYHEGLVPPAYTLAVGKKEDPGEYIRVVREIIPEVYAAGNASAVVLFNDIKESRPGVRYLVTDYGSVERTERISVRFPATEKVREEEGREFEVVQGEVVGVDDMRGLAVIRIEHPDAPRVNKAGRIHSMETGAKMMVIGSACGRDGTATAGIVVSRHSHGFFAGYPYFILTDATITGGNRGGPVVNASGLLVGISVGGGQGPFAGLGLVLPIREVERLAKEIIRNGAVSRGYIGLDLLRELTKGERDSLNLEADIGIFVGRVVEGGPAAQEKFKPGMIILKFNGYQVRSVEQFKVLVGTATIGEEAEVEVLQDGRRTVLRPKIRKANSG